MPDSLHPHGQGLVIGLTGGIGSGKSTILRLLALAGGMREFGRCVDRFADVMHGLTQAADGMK